MEVLGRVGKFSFVCANPWKRPEFSWGERYSEYRNSTDAKHRRKPYSGRWLRLRRMSMTNGPLKASFPSKRNWQLMDHEDDTGQTFSWQIQKYHMRSVDLAVLVSEKFTHDIRVSTLKKWPEDGKISNCSPL